MGSICYKLFSISLSVDARIELMFQEAGNEVYTIVVGARAGGGERAWRRRL
jgi:hypothetical protein